MCRLRYWIAILAVTLLVGPAHAQSWNPFAKKEAPPQAAQPKPNTISTFNPFANASSISLDKMLTIPGLTQPANRPVNQPSIKDRLQASTQQMWAETKRAVTPPMLQNRGQGSTLWPFPKVQKTSFTLPNLFQTTPAPQGPPPTLQDWLAQPRPE